jgi:hypothetical protein
VCPLVVISPGASGVHAEVVGAGVFEGRKLVDLLSFWEWSQDVGDDGMGATREAFQIAEPV